MAVVISATTATSPSSNRASAVTNGLKTPPSPSLNSEASIVSFGMVSNEQEMPFDGHDLGLWGFLAFQQPHHRLTPLDQDRTFEQLSRCDGIRYAAYRAASKLEVLQSALRLDSIKFGVVCNTFHHHGIASAEKNDVVIDITEASDIIADIFFATSKVRKCRRPKKGMPPKIRLTNFRFAATTALQWMWNL